MKTEKTNKKKIIKNSLKVIGGVATFALGIYVIRKKGVTLDTVKDLGVKSINAVKNKFSSFNPTVVISEEVPNDWKLTKQMTSACRNIKKRFFEETGFKLDITAFGNRLGRNSGEVEILKSNIPMELWDKLYKIAQEEMHGPITEYAWDYIAFG